MKIIEFRAENFKRLTAVEIRPDTQLVQITGLNRAGKTSILDAIWVAFAGKSAAPTVPIRIGAEEAIIKLDLGELRVTRKFRAQDDGGYTTSIIVENADGARFPSPQSILDALVGELSFDPLAFTRMKAGDQYETLKRFVPGVDFDAIDAASRADYQARTEINRQAKALRSQADGVEILTDAPAARVDDAGLVSELEKAGQQNAEIERRVASQKMNERLVQSRKEGAAKQREEVAKLRHRANELERGAEQDDVDARALQDQVFALPPIPEPIDTAAITTRIREARAANSRFDSVARAKQDRERLAAQAASLEARSASLTRAMREREDQKHKAISEATMPIPGIGFGDGLVTFNGLPFDQASDAEQLRASIAIAAAMNPRLRVIRVRDGSLLDDNGIRMLGEFADQSDMQIWIERVDNSGRIGFVIEDGHLKSAPVAEAAE